MEIKNNDQEKLIENVQTEAGTRSLLRSSDTKTKCSKRFIHINDYTSALCSFTASFLREPLTPTFFLLPAVYLSI